MAKASTQRVARRNGNNDAPAGVGHNRPDEASARNAILANGAALRTAESDERSAAGRGLQLKAEAMELFAINARDGYITNDNVKAWFLDWRYETPPADGLVLPQHRAEASRFAGIVAATHEQMKLGGDFIAVLAAVRAELPKLKDAAAADENAREPRQLDLAYYQAANDVRTYTPKQGPNKGKLQQGRRASAMDDSLRNAILKPAPVKKAAASPFDTIETIVNDMLKGADRDWRAKLREVLNTMDAYRGVVEPLDKEEEEAA